ncbi:TPA: hypothetical protein ACO3YK_001061 [Salmonella enterica subsp. enterica serovar Strathcona]|nr:hypothetical protein [Salmonella enterica]
MTKRPVNAGRFAVEKKSRRAATCCYLVMPGVVSLDEVWLP